ncbi:MAG: hypothetical protein AAGI30_03030 [Planctomycetota bacterium]
MPNAEGQPTAEENSAPSASAASLSDAKSALGALPALHSPLTPGDAIDQARSLSKSGRLPGFEPNGPHGFRAAVFGTIYDRTLHATVAAHGSGAVVSLRTTLNRKVPAVVIVCLVLAIWPGVLLTHSLLATYFGFYPRSEWVTWAWYVPLTVLAIPVLIKQYRASEIAAVEHAGEVTERLRAAMNATTHPSSP